MIDAEEKTSEAVTAKLAVFVNKRFSAKLDDGKYKYDLIKPCLNKEYSALSSPHIPTGKLFGDELQSQLNSIKASNKISNLAAGASSRRFQDKPGNNNKYGKPFLGQRGKKPHYSQKKQWEKKKQ